MKETIPDKLDCYPKYILHHYKNHPDWVAVRRKDFGIWNNYTWREAFEAVRDLAAGLICLGLKSGEKAVVIGDEEPEGFWAIMATQCAGGVPVPLFSDAQIDELGFLIPHSEAKFVFAEDQEQVDKILELKARLPSIEKVMFWNPKGMRRYSDPLLISYEALRKIGREYEAKHPGIIENIIRSLTSDDIAQFTFTSGTTGQPKASIIPHRVMMYCANILVNNFNINRNDGLLSVLPWGSIFEQWFAGTSYLTGAPMCFCEEPETVQANLREISPKIVFSSTRQYISQCSEIQIKVSDAGWLKRTVYKIFMPVGYHIADQKLAKKKIGFGWQILNRIAEFALFKPTRDKLGFSKTKYPITGSTYLSPDTMRFFWAIGMPLYQIYGSTESGINILHGSGEVDTESIGKPPEGTLVRISEEGEIQVKSPGLFAGYFKNPQATAEKLTADGYYKTGDAGVYTDDKRIIYIDRVSDLRELKTGTRYSPGYIEGKLKFSPYIQEAITLGDKEKDYVSVIIIINFQAAGKWAEDHHIKYTNFPDLSQKDELGNYIERDIRRVNHALPENLRVKKYVLLHKEFDADDAEVTRTRKLRRKYIEENYHNLISAIYNNSNEFEVEAAVKYRDGRTGTIKTNLRIREIVGTHVPSVSSKN